MDAARTWVREEPGRSQGDHMGRAKAVRDAGLPQRHRKGGTLSGLTAEKDRW
jgi:hypothetical protein